MHDLAVEIELDPHLSYWFKRYFMPRLFIRIHYLVRAKAERGLSRSGELITDCLSELRHRHVYGYV